MDMYNQLGTFDLTGKIYGEIKPTGGGWKVKQDNAITLFTGARKDSPEGTSVSFSVCFKNEDEADQFLRYIAPYDPEDPDFDEDVGVDIPLYYRSTDWNLHLWGIVAKPVALNKTPMDFLQYCYDLVCYCYSPYSYARMPTTWALSGVTSLPVTAAIPNVEGHIASSFESLAITCTYNAAHVKNLVFSLTDSDSAVTSLTLCDEALSDEIWELRGNENIILETYEDPIVSDVILYRDTTKSISAGGFYAPWACMALVAGEYFYYKLSGPNQVRKPVKMTAEIYLTTASDLITVDISSDGVAWTTVLTQADFGVQDFVEREYVLPGTESMTDAYVRFMCTVGSPVSVCLGSIKFEVERWVEYGVMPTVARGESATASIDATTGSEYCDIDGEFYARRKFL